MIPVTSLVIKAASQNHATILFPGNIYAYGNSKTPINEETKPVPATKKGIVRQETENLLEEAARQGHCRVINLRLPDFWGPNVTNGLIKPLFGNAARGKPMRWMIRGDISHQFVYTPDAAEMFFKLTQQKGLPEYAFFIYGGTTYSSVRAFASRISRLAESPDKLMLYSKGFLRLLGVFVPVVREMKELTYQFENSIILDDSKLRSLYPGWRETEDETAITDTLNWYRMN